MPVVAALVATICAPSSAAPIEFSADEVSGILSHGPWPAPQSRDPSNRVSGKQEAIEFGTQLFFEPRLSGNGKVSCATCHVPERNWTDNQERSVAIGQMDRNTPTLMNIRLGKWFGWDGGSDSLWSQSIRPMLDPRELGANSRHVAELIRNDKDLSCRYRKAFGTAPSPNDDESVMVDAAKAMAAFQETLQSGRTPFDAFRDALARGDRAPDWRYSEAAQRGLKLFIGKAMCSTCHTGPNFTSGEFHKTGLAGPGAPVKVDPGREEGIRKVRATPYNLLGKYNDDPTRTNADHTRELRAETRNFGEFKIPSLRNAILTVPYGHDGRVQSLAEVVKHYSERGPGRIGPNGERIDNPLRLTANEQVDLVVFLESLSTFVNPWRPEEGAHCY